MFVVLSALSISSRIVTVHNQFRIQSNSSSIQFNPAFLLKLSLRCAMFRKSVYLRRRGFLHSNSFAMRFLIKLQCILYRGGFEKKHMGLVSRFHGI